jgi:ABC-type arginine transport system permease subunit
VKRFWKRRHPHSATLEAIPGVTNLRLTKDGTVVALVVLHDISWTVQGGATVTFMDLTNFMESRKVPLPPWAGDEETERT